MYSGLKAYYRPRLFSIHLFIFLTVAGVFNANTLNAEELRAHPGSIVFNAVQGHSLNITRSIFIFTTGDTPLSWSRTKNASWITTNITNGVSESVLNVNVNTVGMSPGIYNGNVHISSAESTLDPIDVEVTLIVNPDVPVKITTWKDGYKGAMSVSVDDSKGSGFDELHANGFTGTYVLEGETPWNYYTDYYNAGMELGSHTVHHLCASMTDEVFRTQEIEPNIFALCHRTPIPCKDVITFVWPCGSTNYREEGDATDYFLSARGYNINQLEDETPANFMNLKSYNSHEHYPFPPADFKTLVDAAIAQGKWYNLVLHDYTNEDGAIAYSYGKDIWVSAIGTVIKYILQRDRFIVTDYNENTDLITCNVSRLGIPPSNIREFENAFYPEDVVTLQIDYDDENIVDHVLVNGSITPYTIADINGNKVLRVNVRLESSNSKSIEIRYNTAQFTLSISGVTASDKVYNGTTNTTIHKASATLVGVQSGDNVTLISTGAVGSFATETAGQSKSVITSGFTLGGANASRYFLMQPVLTANITKKNLTISGVTANDKVYNGNTVATINTGSISFSGVIAGDAVSLVTVGASGTFSDKNAEEGKPVTISGLTIGGPDGPNYTLTQPATFADINPANIQVTGITAGNKVYDGTTSVSLNTVNATLSGVIPGDMVNLDISNVTGSFQSKNPGTGKTILIAGFSLSGANNGNYTIVQPLVTANITKATLNMSGITALNKIYDGTITGQLNSTNSTLSGIKTGDNVILNSSGASGIFQNKNAGTDKIITTSGFNPGGTDGGNYNLVQLSLTADITKATVTVSGVTANNKVYDGTTSASLNSTGGIAAGKITGDNVTLISLNAVGVFTNKNTGIAKSVTASGFTLGGSDAGNYNLTQPVLLANITPRPITVTANNLTKSFGTAMVFNGTEYTVSGLVLGDAITGVTLSSPGAAVSAMVGTYPVTVANGSNNNYSFNYVSSTLTVNKATLTIKADDKERFYRSENPALTISYSGFINGDNPSVLTTQAIVSTTAGAASATGSYPIILTGCSDDNYNIILQNGILTVNKVPLTVSATSQTRFYGEINADFNVIYSGFVQGEDESVLIKKPVIQSDAEVNSNAGTYDINVSGASGLNYSFIYKKGLLTVTKANQYISFEVVPEKLKITEESRLVASASSGLTVDFKLSDPSIADLNGNIITILRDGNLTIKAFQTGDRNWNPATEVAQSLKALPKSDNISSLFTPNNDGMNDYWYISELEKYGKLEVTVFNRFGQMVYKSDSYKNDWDGTWNSHPLPTAAYYYIIKSSKLGMLKGVVNIAR